MENKFYGVKPVIENPSSSLSSHLEEITIQGYTIIENLLNDEDLSKSIEKLDKIYHEQLTQFGEENLKKIKEQNLVRSPLVYDDFFLSIVLKDPIIEIVKHFLGEYFIINQQNGIINMPGEDHHQSA